MEEDELNVLLHAHGSERLVGGEWPEARNNNNNTNKRSGRNNNNNNNNKRSGAGDGTI